MPCQTELIFSIKPWAVRTSWTSPPSPIVKCPENEVVSMTRMNFRNHFCNTFPAEVDQTIVTLL